jgi:acetyl-CoA C-acetyltransferase
LHELDFVELHDAYTSSEIQTYEDLGLCRYGEGGPFAESGKAFLPNIDYGLKLKDKARLRGESLGRIDRLRTSCRRDGTHAGVFAVWQLQGTVKSISAMTSLQVKDAKRGAIHSHAGTGTYVTVSVLEREG